MEVVSYPRRDEVWLISLDPSRGSEIKKTRPCLVVSPDEMNEPLANRHSRSHDNDNARLPDAGKR